MRAFRNLLTLIAAAAGACASAETVATFADPALDESTPLFDVRADEVTGGWDGGGLNLEVALTNPPSVFQNATFTMTDLTRSGNDLGGGTIEFFEAASEGGELILRIEFVGATLQGQIGFAAQDVEFSGPAALGQLTDGEFSFNFANPDVTGSGTTYTAAFASSATVEVPDDNQNDNGGDDNENDNGGDNENDNDADNDNDDDGGNDNDGGGNDNDDDGDNDNDGADNDNDGDGDGDDDNDNDGDDDDNGNDNGDGGTGELLECGAIPCGANAAPMMPTMLLMLAAMKLPRIRRRVQRS